MALAHPTIVCGVDGSEESTDLVRIAARLAELVGAHLALVHVLGSRRQSWPGVVDARRTLMAMCDAEGVPDAERHVVPYGDPARRIGAIAEQRRALLIVVGTRGATAAPDAILGSVSSRLAADAPAPVLVVPPRLAPHVDPTTWSRRTFVCGLDGSAAGWGAARQSALLAARLRGELMLVSVGSDAMVADDDVDRELMLAAGAGLQSGSDRAPFLVRRDVRHGDAAWELERVAAALTAPLIAIGSRGLGPEDALLGCVARRVLGAARRPTLIVPVTSVLEERAAERRERVAPYGSTRPRRIA